MKKTPSSIAWLNSKYSRTKGQVARLGERIKDVEARLDLHRHKSQQCEEQLVALRDALAQAETLSEQFAHALKLHELAPQVEAVGKILPNEHRRFFKHGGMTAAIYRSIKSAPAGMLTINHNGLALPEVPFGGIKDSGYGTEGGSEAVDAYLETRFVTMAN